MDIWTGRKEAKLNDPSDDEDGNRALEGLRVDSGVGVVVVEPQAGADESGSLEDLIPSGAPVYESYGRVKPPEEESGQFYSNLEYVKKGPGGTDLPFDEALEFLEDISHDIYYGEKIAENPDTVQALLCLMVQRGEEEEGEGEEPTTSDRDDATASPPPRNQQAASIVAAALQNNPPAARMVGDAWPSLMESTCTGPQGRGFPLRDGFYAPFAPLDPSARRDVPAAQVKARVGALSSLLRSPAVRDDFLASGGMDRLLEALTGAAGGGAWMGVQRKVGHLLLDHFLDEESGATKGLWPVFRASEPDAAKRKLGREADEKWIEAVRVVRERDGGNDGEHWSVAVLRELEGHHAAQLKGLPKEEL
ncbi:hypothetical protein SODALDRAFT_331323 [Sodiomyces alkalinus F11]|uniref:Nucleotide exchange factor SIL1 n=1 Tax=Sodiomyces alkalinus (strain CBS 110278 / VKM F-3762 / F11) TaxID=1314773 RepID=A0A3N2Q4F0_SODAK|nr:hypothetical protein SODALDRAFT_331323 [Sodiomyces alkalinus F11]ROT41577.1 hypothetical protein SODALDRAFT_331323 [Sodiomyces alkalinus F11]